MLTPHGWDQSPKIPKILVTRMHVRFALRGSVMLFIKVLLLAGGWS